MHTLSSSPGFIRHYLIVSYTACNRYDYRKTGINVWDCPSSTPLSVIMAPGRAARAKVDILSSELFSAHRSYCFFHLFHLRGQAVNTQLGHQPGNR